MDRGAGDGEGWEGGGGKVQQWVAMETFERGREQSHEALEGTWSGEEDRRHSFLSKLALLHTLDASDAAVGVFGPAPIGGAGENVQDGGTGAWACVSSPELHRLRNLVSSD